MILPMEQINKSVLNSPLGPLHASHTRFYVHSLFSVIRLLTVTHLIFMFLIALHDYERMKWLPRFTL